MGSGVRIKRTIKKYGVENFTKEYLGIYDTEEKMNLAERVFVVLDEEVSYNICPGGKGGWGYVNQEQKNIYPEHANRAREHLQLANIRFRDLLKTDDNFRERYSKSVSDGVKNKWATDTHPWIGRKHTNQTKEIISQKNAISQKGHRNSQYGTCWITNSRENRKIKKDELNSWIQEGWYKGRS